MKKNKQEKRKEELIMTLTKMLIETDFYEKEKKVDVYIKKTRVYKDLIKLAALFEIKGGIYNSAFCIFLKICS